MKLENFLSFGDAAEPLELQALNVFIGPNGSGKSNIGEALALLRATPTDLEEPIRSGGGIQDWLWKGGPARSKAPVATIEAVVDYPKGKLPLRYRLSFSAVASRVQIVDERVENERPLPGHDKPYLFFGYENGRPMVNVRGEERRLLREDLDPHQSVLSQRKDPEHYPELTYLGKFFGNFRLFREWNLGRYTPPRMPQKTDLPEDFLLEDASNLALVLNDLEHHSDVKKKILDSIKRMSESIQDFTVKIHGGTVQLHIHERGLRGPIPATRMSDGTLRYLCLLSILCHPSPPPLIWLEEPELGLHPDILPVIAQLMLEASERTQLLVTTHSDILVDALTEHPESVVVCDRPASGTSLRRLEASELKNWLERYSLGQLWLKGEIGGTRW